MVKINLEEEIGRAENRFLELKADTKKEDITEIAVGYVVKVNPDPIQISYWNTIKNNPPKFRSTSSLRLRGISEVGQRVAVVYYMQHGNEVLDFVAILDSDKTPLKLDSAEIKNPFGVYY